MLAGRPKPAPPGERDKWDEAVAEVTAAILKAGNEFFFSDEDLGHRRGDFPARLFGVSHGGGQTVGIFVSGGLLYDLRGFRSGPPSPNNPPP